MLVNKVTKYLVNKYLENELISQASDVSGNTLCQFEIRAV